MSSLAWIALSMAAISRTLVEAKTEDVTVPVHDAALLSCLGKDSAALSASPMQVSEMIGHDLFQATLLEVLRNALQPALSSLAIVIHVNRDQ